MMTETKRVNSKSVLEIDSLRKEFPGVAALDGVSLEIKNRKLLG